MDLRLSVLPVVVAVSAVVLTMGTAAAQPGVPPTITTLPERPTPTGVTSFTDNPAIVDTYPQAIASWSRQPRPDVLAVNFTTGTPECYGVHAEIQETADIVAVKLRSGTLPDAVGRACIAIGVFATLPVTLTAPVGTRAVVSIT